MPRRTLGRLSQPVAHGFAQVSFSALPAAPGRAWGGWREQLSGAAGVAGEGLWRSPASAPPTGAPEWELPRGCPARRWGWAVTLTSGMSGPGVTQVTQACSRASTCSLSQRRGPAGHRKTAPAQQRTRAVHPGLAPLSKVPAQAQPRAAEFSGSVTHASGQGGVQGDESGDGRPCVGAGGAGVPIAVSRGWGQLW